MKEIKADLHNHLSTFSNIPKKFNKVIDIAEQKLGKRGILGIANYNDNRYEKFISLKKGYERQNFGKFIYVPEKKIFVIKAQEVLSKQGHILVLGLEEKVRLKSGRSLEYSLKQAKGEDGTIIGNHLFFILGAGNYLRKRENQKLLKYFHGFEIHNGEAFYGNKNAKRFYWLIKDSYNIGALSFSDGHSLYEIGSSYTLLENINVNPMELISSLRDSIKNHKDYSKDKQHFSRLGCLDHSIDTIGMGILMALGKKFKHLN